MNFDILAMSFMFARAEPNRALGARPICSVPQQNLTGT